MGRGSMADDPVNVRAFEVVREAIRRSGLSIDELGARSGVPTSTIKNLRGSKAVPIHAQQLVKLAEALGEDPAEWIREVQFPKQR